MLTAGTFFAKMLLKKAFPYFLHVLGTMKLFFESGVSRTYVRYRKIVIFFETTESVIVILYTAERIRISRRKTYILYSDRRKKHG